MSDIHIAIAGTSEASSADFVCDGVDDDVEIQAAIDAAGSGGGTVFFGAGNYSVSKSIAVLSDGVSLQGDTGGGTVLTAASNWVAGTTPEGALTTGVVSFVGVDNFAARNLTIQSDGLLTMNGLEAIPAGPLPAGPEGSGRICTNGVFESNTLKMTQGHTYSIWSVRSENMSIINNHVDGGGTIADSNNEQEGIEIFGGHNVLISGNHVEGIGNAAINLGGLAAATSDCSVDGITVTDNHVNDCRLGVFIGTTWDAVNGAASAKDISITGNDFTGLFEGGFLIRNWTGTPLDGAPEISGIEFSDNKVNLVYSNSAGFTPAAVWFFDAHPGETTHGEIVVSGNEFTTTLVDDAPTLYWLNPTFSEFVGFEHFSGVTFQDNQVDLSNSDANSRGIVLFDSQDIAVESNTIRGAGLYPFYSYSSNFSFDGNTILDWGHGADQPAMMIYLPGDYSIADNEIVSPGAASGLIVVTGDAGNNILDSAGGADTLIGLGGDDTYNIDDAAVKVVEVPGDGFDTITTSVSYTLDLSNVEALSANDPAATTAINLIGNGYNQTLTGNAGNNILHGGGGDDTLIGLGGDDTYYMDDARVKVIEAPGGGFDSIYTSTSYTLGTLSSVEALSTSDSGATTAIDLTGNAFDQTLTGNAGNNILDGGGGADTLIGLGGDDTYTIDDARVKVVEAPGEGFDTIHTSVSYTLGSLSSVEALSTNDDDATTAIDLTGNGFDQTLTGNAGNNTLDGGGGDDTLIGLGGDDTYTIDDARVNVVEAPGEGLDTIHTSVSYTLGSSASVEALSTNDDDGTTAIDLTGNGFDQTLTGNAGNNILDGGGGDDTLIGLGGDDTYSIDDARVKVIEAAGGGFDTIHTSVSYTLGSLSSVEALSANDPAATTAIDLTGNAFDQTLTGNAGNNILDGGGGEDTLIGLGGDDTYNIDDARVKVVEAPGGGSDTIHTSVSYTLGNLSNVEALSTNDDNATIAIDLTGNGFDQTLTGNAGNNILDGGGGEDTLIGLGGDDTYNIDDARAKIVEAAGGGFDTIHTSVSYTLDSSASVEALSTSDSAATTAIDLTGNGFDQTLTGNAGNNILDGGGGDDTLIGLGGDDTYNIDDARVKVIEAPGGGLDTIHTSVSYALDSLSSVEALSANDPAATTAIDLTGNAFDQTLTGNAGNNILDGGGGADTLIGLGGDDTYNINDARVKVIEATGDGFDTINTSVSYALGSLSNVEALSANDAAATTAVDLTGNGFDQTLTGNAGNNILDGGGGDDTLIGLGGDDTYTIDDARVKVVEAPGDGFDTINTSVSYALGSLSSIEALSARLAAGTASIDLTGNGFDQTLTGNAGNNILDGGGGDDTLIGLGGDDTYTIDDARVKVIEASGGGFDTIHTSVSYTLGSLSSVEALSTNSPTGTTAIDLTGNAFDQTLTGNAGNNLLDGGGGADTLIGLDGDDTYTIDDARVKVVEAPGGGFDTINTSVSYALGSLSNVEALSANDAAATTAVDLTGNGFDQTLTGNAGSNILDGGGGGDTLIGLGGDDTYNINDARVKVIEAPGDGFDTIRSSVSYTLGSLSSIEALSTSAPTGTAVINLTGNAFDQTLTGNAGKNILDGGGGDDTLVGLGGDDIYYIDDARAKVIEAPGGGFDIVYSSASYTLGSLASVEALSTNSLTATTAIDLTGNGFDQTLTGNAGNNRLDGGGGADTLIGLGGDDIYYINDARVKVVEAPVGDFDTIYTSVSYSLDDANIEALSANDPAAPTSINLTGNGFNQTLTGNAGNNRLHGGGGADTLIGLGGDDIYYTDDARVKVVETPGGGFDTLYTSVSYALGDANVELLSTNDTGATAAINLTGNAFDQTLTGNAGNNILDGGGGDDTLIGLGGDDTYTIDDARVKVVEALGKGFDTVRTSVSYALGSLSSVEALSTNAATATTAINLTGNSFDQTLTGNAGNNILDGGGGADTLIGLGGDDTYIIADARVNVSEAPGSGFDTLTTSVSYSLGDANIELLSTTNTAATTAINLTGNGYNQTLIGNAGNNRLHGGGGADTLIGLGGNDIYYTDDARVKVVEAAGEGFDTIYTSVSYALGSLSSVEALSTNDAGATAAINLTGNGFDQTLTGNAGNNILNGGGGADTLIGLGGNDTYTIDDARVKVIEAPVGEFDTVYTSVSYSLGDANVELLSTSDTAATTAIDLDGNGFKQTLIGNAGSNHLHGGGGADTLIGLGGDDTYYTDDAGVTVVEAPVGDFDSLYTSVSYTLGDANIELLSTNDTAATSAINLTGNGFKQTLIGNAGNNHLHGGGGADTLIGLGGDDIYYTDDAGVTVVEAPGGGFDSIYTSVSYALGDASVELLSTNDPAATSAINLTGNGFNQTLIGNAGNNILNGGGGADTLTGLGGHDTFVFDIALGSSNVGTITDFDPALDTIALKNTVFTAFAAVGELATSAFTTGTQATTAAQHIIYDSTHGDLYYDADGVGGAAATKFASLSPGLALTNHDFLIV